MAPAQIVRSYKNVTFVVGKDGKSVRRREREPEDIISLSARN
jgi:hypothetical protein